MKEALLKDKQIVSALDRIRLTNLEREMIETLLDKAYITGQRDGGIEILEKWKKVNKGLPF